MAASPPPDANALAEPDAPVRRPEHSRLRGPVNADEGDVVRVAPALAAPGDLRESADLPMPAFKPPPAVIATQRSGKPDLSSDYIK
jgi:hypothetical protein